MEPAPPEAPLDHPLRMAVLISGGGTTLDNFVQKIEAGILSAEISSVIASRPDCGGIDKARKYNLPVEVCDRKEFSSVETFSEQIFTYCREKKIELVALSGFLCLLQIPEDFENRVLNIHPSLIPAFCGKGYHGSKVHQAVFERGAKISGCTVHFADNHYDHGPIIIQKPVDIEFADSPRQIAAKVFEQECIAYPEAIQLFAKGRLRIIDQRVEIVSPN